MSQLVEYGSLVKDTKVLHLSTQTTGCILLNGSMKSKAAYDVRGFLNFENDDSIEYVTLQLPYVVMSNSNYIVNAYNNKLYYDASGISYEGTISPGNYTVATFRTALLGFLPNGFTITYDTTINRYLFSYNAPFSFKTGSTCDYIIGFTGTENAVLNGSTYQLRPSRAFNFLPIPRYVIHCNLLSDGIILGTNSTLASSDILATIPNVSKPNGQLVYENIASEFMVKVSNIGQIVITITDDNNREIDFNGISSYFQIKFNIFRKGVKKPMKFGDLVEHISRTTIQQEPEES